MEKKRKITDKAVLIRQFKRDYYNAFGIIVKVQEITETAKKIQDFRFFEAEELEEIFNNYISYKRMNACKNFLTNNRQREKVEMRMIFMKMLRQLGYKVKEIGKYCNNRDHTTAIYNIRVATDLLEYSESFSQLYQEMAQEVRLQKKIKNRINHIYGRTTTAVPEAPALIKPDHAPAAHQNEDKSGKHRPTSQFRGKLAYTKGLPQQRVSTAPKSRNPAY